MALFLLIFLSIWGAMHSYVFWRLSSVPFIAHHVSPLALGCAGAVLWLSYFVARVLDSKGFQRVIWPLEYFAANWIGLLFLLFWAFVLLDVVTLGGVLVPGQVPGLRTSAAILACLLALVAWVQGLRPPVVTDYEVKLTGLPRERDGLVLLHLSDLHLGNLLGRKWLAHLINRVNEMKPDIIVIVGDLVDANVGRVEPLRDVLQTLRAPLGVWSVTGNHEHYAGLERSVRLLQGAGFHVLRDGNEQVVPGLVMAGVDDLTAREDTERAKNIMDEVLANRPAGGTILLSHSPMQAEKAANAGVGLMLSGHTHNGQIWPFNYLVRTRFRLLTGRSQIGSMAAIVCRGTGTWGPRMRLWKPSEMVRIRLRAG